MPIATLKRLRVWRPGRLAWNTTHASLWNFLRVVLQAGTLVLMAKSFGAAGYGSLVGTVALYTTCAQLAGLGSGVALVRHIARQGELHGKLRSTQIVYLGTSAALFLIAWPVSIWLLQHGLDAVTLGLLAAAELVVAPALLPLVFRYQAQERLAVSGALQTIAPVARFVAIASAAVLGTNDLRSFALLYLGFISIGVTATLWCLWPRTSVITQHYRLLGTIKEGIPYIISGLAVAAGSELDKTIMLRSAGNVAAGQYTAAYRVAQAIVLPVNSLMLAATPRLFKAAHPSLQAGIRLIIAAVTYAVIAAVITWLIAPLLPLLLGAQFGASAPLLRVMCVLLVTASVRQIVVAQLTAADGQGARNWIEGSTAVGTVLAMILIVPSFGALGAISVLATADICVAAASWNLIRTKVRDLGAVR